MAVQLKKGATVNLKKESPNLNRILVGLGWDPAKTFFGIGPDMDIDASVICIDKKGRKDSIVYYHNLREYKGAIRHYGDNLTGEGDGDDEQIEIILDELPNRITRLSIIINIYNAYSRRQNFGKVKNCFVHVTDLDTRKELVRYDIDGNYNGLTGIFVADIYREDNDWKFSALGDGAKVRDISEMARMKCE